METLGKREVAEVIAVAVYGQSVPLKKIDAYEEALNALLVFIEDSLKQNLRVHFKNFGSLVPKFKNARMGRNPKTMEPHEIPARVTVTFLPRSYKETPTDGKVGTCDMKKEMRKYFDTVTEAERFIDLLAGLFNSAIEDNLRFEFRHFGTFTPKVRKSRKTHNPATGDKITTDEKTVIHFKVSKKLVERLTACMM